MDEKPESTTSLNLYTLFKLLKNCTFGKFLDKYRYYRREGEQRGEAVEKALWQCGYIIQDKKK